MRADPKVGQIIGLVVLSPGCVLLGAYLQSMVPFLWPPSVGIRFLLVLFGMSLIFALPVLLLEMGKLAFWPKRAVQLTRGDRLVGLACLASVVLGAGLGWVTGFGTENFMGKP